MVEAPMMSKEELKEKLNRSDLKIIDVRKNSDYEQSDEKITGAIRESPTEVRYWMEKYPRDTSLVLY